MKRDPNEFSLTPCGLADRIQARIGLLSEESPRIKRRAAYLALVAWLPLLVVALIQPRVDEVQVTFFQDVAAHVRFLMVIPILILIERSIGLRTKLVAAEFAESGLVGEGDIPRLHAAVRTTVKRLDSIWAELILLALAYAFTAFATHELLHDGALFWFEERGAGGERLTLAGIWYIYVSSPLVSFLFLRWIWRYCMWSWFLHRVSRLDLRIACSHPDRAGGLGFVNIGQTSFASLALAASCVLAAAGANRILYEGMKLTGYQSIIIGFIVLSAAFGLAPLLAFLRPLLLAKWKGVFRYGQFGTRYVQTFEQKWLGKPTGNDEPMLGSADIQSLADLGGSFDRVDNMRLVPFDRRTVTAFVFAAAAPMLPLLLTVMPLKEIAKLLIKAMV